jgi:DNA (cytosine-5)-methyltransferase 1
MRETIMSFNAVELCAGGGGQALGLELAGFRHEAAVEYEPHFCATLRRNRPKWNVVEADIRNLQGRDYRGVDLLAAGVPCPPFSVAGRQLGADDERDMFPTALQLVEEMQPRAVLFENVQGFASAKFEAYRLELLRKLTSLGFQPDWRVLQASDFGVPQLRPRFILVALRAADAEHFAWPAGNGQKRLVGESLLDLMSANGWPHAGAWAQKAAAVAPTVVGGSKKHGGPDLGPTRAKRQWLQLGVDGMGIANDAPSADAAADHAPRLTVRMVTRVQSFPDAWEFAGGKTVQYRQVGNAFPPLVAKAVGCAIRDALDRKCDRRDVQTDDSHQMRFLRAAGRPASRRTKRL